MGEGFGICTEVSCLLLHVFGALNFHVDEELHGDADEHSSHNTEIVVTGHVWPEHYFATTQSKTKHNETGTNDLS